VATVVLLGTLDTKGTEFDYLRGKRDKIAGPKTTFSGYEKAAGARLEN